MRILSVVPVMGAGGAEVVTASLSIDARRRGHDVTLASSGGFRANEAAAAGVRLLDVRMNGRRPSDLISSVRAVRRFARSSEPDVVHAHNVKAALIARAAVGSRTPVVTTVHGIPANELPLAARILRWSSRRVVAVSPYVAEQLAASGVPERRIDVIENTITPLPVRDRTQARARLGLDTDEPVALCAARMVDQKRHDLLIDAWTEVPSATLLLAGDGPLRRGIQQRIADRGLSHRVQVLGERTDVDWLLAAADLLVLPTDWEGLPISLLEAMAAGVPVVVSRVGGVIETLGEAVRLVEPGSSTALSEALTELLDDAGLRAELSEAGRTLIAERFSADRMLSAYRDLYARLAPRDAR